MKLLPVEIIRKKRDGEILQDSQIKDFMQAFLEGEISDYQMSAWLMAAYLKGLDYRECSSLTKVMLDSGAMLATSESERVMTIDKHSTGGIGDKTTMIIVPILSLLGYRVPTIAGRSLGITGGTLDKLESIQGL